MKRPPSYSESYISELNFPNNFTTQLLSELYICDNKTKYENTLEPTKTLENTMSINSNNIIVYKPILHRFNYCELILNKLISYTFHLLLIAGFEIIFFNFFILSFENNSLIGLFDQLVQPIINTCSNLPNNSKVIVNNFINLYVNETIINKNANNDYINRMNVNTLVYYTSIYYFVGILCFLIGLIITNFVWFKQKIKFMVIITDNIIMISILGMYEYIFFSTIIFKYMLITPNELFKIVMQNILSMC